MAEKTATPESESDLQLKKRARRRLVGAVALALLAAIVLPMVMDHEPRPPVQDIQVRIPSQEAGNFTSRVLPSKPTATPLPPVKLDKPEPTAESRPPEPAPLPEVKPEPKPESKPIEPQVAKPEAKKPEPAKPEPHKPEVKPAETARAEKILGGGDAAKSDAKPEQWVLQLGAYQELGNVKVLQGKIKELGYPSYTEKVTTPQGDRIRVRAGPFASKAAAEKAQAGLKRIGAGGPPGGVVAPK